MAQDGQSSQKMAVERNPLHTEFRNVLNLLDNSTDILGLIKREVKRAGIVVIRSFPNVDRTTQEFKKIMSEFGEAHIESRDWTKHAPSRDMIRISKNKTLGENLEPHEWGLSIDRVHTKTPSSYLGFHMLSAAHGDETEFLQSKVIVRNLSHEDRAKFELVTLTFGSKTSHSLLFMHPNEVTELMMISFEHPLVGINMGSNAENEQSLSQGEVDDYLNRVKSRIDNFRPAFYVHRWNKGDIVIIDNLAVAHRDKWLKLEKSSIQDRIAIKSIYEPMAVEKVTDEELSLPSYDLNRSQDLTDASEFTFHSHDVKFPTEQELISKYDNVSQNVSETSLSEEVAMINLDSRDEQTTEDSHRNQLAKSLLVDPTEPVPGPSNLPEEELPFLDTSESKKEIKLNSDEDSAGKTKRVPENEAKKHKKLTKKGSRNKSARRVSEPTQKVTRDRPASENTASSDSEKGSKRRKVKPEN